jgi:hypothetical protein
VGTGRGRWLLGAPESAVVDGVSHIADMDRDAVDNRELRAALESAKELAQIDSIFEPEKKKP